MIARGALHFSARQPSWKVEVPSRNRLQKPSGVVLFVGLLCSSSCCPVPHIGGNALPNRLLRLAALRFRVSRISRIRAWIPVESQVSVCELLHHGAFNSASLFFKLLNRLPCWQRILLKRKNHFEVSSRIGTNSLEFARVYV